MHSTASSRSNGLQASRGRIAPLPAAVLLVVLTALTFLTMVSDAAADPSGRIIGGRPVAGGDPGWTAAVALVSAEARSPHAGYVCGGVLVAPRLVLTARHCVESPPFVIDHRRYDVVRGRGAGATLPRNGWKGVARARVLSVHRSPGRYAEAMSRGADLAILQVGAVLPGTSPLPWARPADAAWWGGAQGRREGVRAYGWGVTRDGNTETGAGFGATSPVLRSVALPTIAEDTCAAAAERPAESRRYLCAGEGRTAAVPRSACFGDSGGPLIAERPPEHPATEPDASPVKLIGIVSGNDTARCADGHGRFVRIADHVDWLDGFLPGPQQPPYVYSPQVTRVTATRTGHRITLQPAGSATETRASVVMANLGSGWWLEVGRVSPTGGPIDLPPTRWGGIYVSARTLNIVGTETHGSDWTMVRTRTDRTAPRLGRATATPLGDGHWRLGITRPVDDDRVVAVLVEKRKPGSRTWLREAIHECGACWTNRRARMPVQFRHVALPGRWQFRFTPIDRANNGGRPVVARPAS